MWLKIISPPKDGFRRILNKVLNRRIRRWKKNTEKEFRYKELTGEIISSSYNVLNTLGCGLLEKIYENSLVWELELRKKKVFPQKEFKVIYREKKVGVYYADLVIENKVIIEVKAVENIDNVHRAQLLNYLRISGLRVGLIINFAKPKLQYERLVV
ncbi:MAG: GxxExxY protein [Candidatus Omnitrophica bacterium]|nr:GxxExxY protein [Candidatus Omnitrophota bacterium]